MRHHYRYHFHCHQLEVDERRRDEKVAAPDDDLDLLRPFPNNKWDCVEKDAGRE